MAYNAGSIEATASIDRTLFQRDLDEMKAAAREFADRGIEVKVDVDSDDAYARLDALHHEADHLDGKDVNINVDLKGADEAAVKLALLDEEADTTEKSVTRLNKSAGESGGSMNPLIAAIAILGPALIPIAPVAIAAGGALAGMGAAGILAFKGISDQIKAGTPLGEAYSTVLGGLKGVLSGLEDTAARGVFKGFAADAGIVQQNLGFLNKETSIFSATLGDLSTHVLAGFFSLLQAAAPTLNSFALAIDNGAAGFQKWAAGSGAKDVQAFMNYASTEGPKVVSTFMALGEALVHIAEGLAPLGGTVLTIIKALADVINALPVDVIKDFALVAATGFGLKSGIGFLDQAAGSLAKMGFEMTAAAGAAALITVAIVAGGEALSNYIDGGKKAFDIMQHGTETMMSFADAIKADNDSIGDHTKSLAVTQLQTTGLADTFKKAGVSLTDLGSAVTGSDIMFANFVSTLKDTKGVSNDSIISLEAIRAQFLAGEISANDYTTAIGNLTKQNGIIVSQDPEVTASVDKTSAAYKAAATNVDAYTKALDDLNGTQQSVEQTQDAYLDSLTDVSKALLTNGATLDQATTKGRANREVILSSAQAADKEAQAQIARGDSIDTVTAQYEVNRKKLIAVAEQSGLSEKAATDYVNQLLKTPAQVTTQIQLNDQAALNALDGFGAKLSYYSGILAIDVGRAMSLAPLVDAAIGSSAAFARANQADGSVLKFYADGGKEDHVAQMASANTVRVWAEPETGGESYIPHAPEKRVRSEQILAQTAEQFGMKVTKMADGGSLASMGATASPAGGMNHAALAEMIGSQVAAQLKPVLAARSRSDHEMALQRLRVGALGGS